MTGVSVQSSGLMMPIIDHSMLSSIAIFSLTLPDPKRAVSEWKRVLKPGGRVVIIDGSWGDFNSLRRQIRRYLISMPLILITERRNPCRSHYDREIEKQLPMRQRKRPEVDVKILENLGFSVTVADVKVPRTQTLLDSLKYGSWGDRGYFLVKGIKDNHEV